MPPIFIKKTFNANAEKNLKVCNFYFKQLFKINKKSWTILDQHFVVSKFKMCPLKQDSNQITAICFT